METSKELAGRIREVFLSGKWIANTNYFELLSGVSRDQATQKYGDLNTIAALTQHIDYYLLGILNVFEGGNLEIRDVYSFDFPEITSEAEWQSILDKFFSHAEKFAILIEKMTDSDLEAVFVDQKYGTVRRNIEAMIEHSYYHMGQITLIKKLLANSL